MFATEKDINQQRLGSFSEFQFFLEKLNLSLLPRSTVEKNLEVCNKNIKQQYVYYSIAEDEFTPKGGRCPRLEFLSS